MKLKPFSITLEPVGVVRIREVVPRDKDLLRIGFEKLSDQSRTFRFLAAHPRLTEDELARFVAPNDEDHFAIGALTGPDSAPVPMGTARYIRLQPGEALAEFAVTIIDAYHGIGLGSLMLGVLAKHAVNNGISEFVAFVHEENDRMLALLGELGAVADTTTGPPESEFRVPLHEDAARYPRTMAGDSFRLAYRLAELS